MKKISTMLFVLGFSACAAGLARAQDAATQQQIDQINGRIQDIQDAQAAQGKQIATLEKQLSDLQDKLNQPGGNNFASADDLTKLAGQVQDLAKKQQDDNEQILKAFEKLGKAGPTAAPLHHSTANEESATPDGPKQNQNGFEYPVQPNDTLSAIAKAYTAQGHRVTVKQILDANPGLTPKNLIPGKKIFIPQP
jgi:LysM repeat protein